MVIPLAQHTARQTALSMIRSVALHEAAHRRTGADRPPPADWEMYNALTDVLVTWRQHRAVRRNAALLTEHLAVHLIAYRMQGLRDQERVEVWLRAFGDEVCRVQQHAHPAGPTAVEILSVVAADPYAEPDGLGGAERCNAITRATLRYLRLRHEVEDARELALTLGMWAGAHLSALLHHDADRITNYVNGLDSGRDINDGSRPTT